MKYGKVKHELGFYQVSPTPGNEELNDYYSKKYFQESKSKSYAKSYSNEELEFINSKAVITQQIWKKKPGHILDIVCGEGFLIKLFKENDWKVTACDFSSFGLKEQNPDLMEFFKKGDIFEILETLEEKYDIINLSNVLEHVREPLKLLDMIKSLLKEDGLMRIEVPNDFSDFQEHLQKSGKTQEHWFAPPDHLNYFTFKSLRNVLDNRGFVMKRMLADFPIEMFLTNEHSNYAMVHHGISINMSILIRLKM